MGLLDGKSNLSPRKPKKRSSSQTPQDILSTSCKQLWPECELEYGNVVPKRKYRIDIAFPAVKLAIEMDGWQYHGKFLSDFQRDRERQNLLTLQGWCILRFTTKDVRQNLASTLDTIQMCLDILKHDRKPA